MCARVLFPLGGGMGAVVPLNCKYCLIGIVPIEVKKQAKQRTLTALSNLSALKKLKNIVYMKQPLFLVSISYEAIHSHPKYPNISGMTLGGGKCNIPLFFKTGGGGFESNSAFLILFLRRIK